MSETIIKVENVSKQYHLGQVGTGTLTRDLQRWYSRIRGKEDPTLKIGQENILAARRSSLLPHRSPEIVWALKDISFDVKQGEVLGIIGKNGAGKSTILKILSQVTLPTTGCVKVKGRIASLLEVGTGFHSELTGRENIFLNGAILGMTKREIKSKFDEIVDFSGVEKYIDTPVKRYSSGMYVRLAFAVAAHLEPEILIIDEVLAVGDAEFQNKCLGKMQDVSRNDGRTVLFVSHNMGAVQKLCRNGMLLSNGKILHTGNVQEVIDKYVNSKTDSTAIFKIPENKQSDKSKGFAHTLQIEDQHNNLLNEVPVGVPWQIRVCFTITDKIKYFIIALGFRTMLDVNIRTVFSSRMDLDPRDYEMIFREDQLLYGEGQLKLSIGLSTYEKAIQYVEDFAIISFSAVNSKITDPRIIRTAASTILNPMEVECKKIQYDRK